MLVCSVSFKDGGKLYDFDCNNIDLELDNYVIVSTEKGNQFGKIKKLEELNTKKDLKPVLKKASETDYKNYLKNLKDAKDALTITKKFVEDLDLNMQLVDADYTFDHKQLTINFISDERVDFRELLKLLASKCKARIELHQIGVRDKAREIGGLGQCGRPLCCKEFLNRMDTITINMAKNQNIALNPSKMNGACGRLLCCLSYEDETYTQCKKNLAPIGTIIKVAGKDAKVVSQNALKGSITVDINGELKEIEKNESK